MTTRELSLAELSDLIGVAYDSALEKNQWQTLISRITEMFPGFFGWTSSFHNEYWLGMYTADGFNDLLRERWDTERTEEARVFSEMPDELNDMRRVQMKRQRPALGGILRSRDVFTDDELHAFNFYQQKMAPMGVGHWIGLAFAVSGPRYATIAFAEIDAMPGDKDYDGLQRVIELLAPHVVRAMRLSRALFLAKQSAETFQGFLDVVALPLLVTDRDGILQFGNEAGQRLLEHGHLVHLSGQRLSMADPRDTDRLYQAFRETEDKRRPAGLRIDHEDGPISLCITPFHPQMSGDVQADRDVLEDQALFAIFAGTHGHAAVNPALLQDVFQLTPREAEVCSALVAGKSPAEIADLTGRAEKTIRNQIQSVNEKVGVSSTRALSEALSVFRVVGAMFDADDPMLFAPDHAGGTRIQ